MRILDVGPENVGDLGFFCYMSKKKSVGYARKMAWLERRFDEGLRVKMLELPDRGFIEYISGEYAWRTVDARGFVFVHCLWVVGKSKGKGFAEALLDLCLDDARKSGAAGVAMVTSELNWLVGRRLFEKKGFARLAEAPPAFSLMVNAFGEHRLPRGVPGKRRRGAANLAVSVRNLRFGSRWRTSRLPPAHRKGPAGGASKPLKRARQASLTAHLEASETGMIPNCYRGRGQLGARTVVRRAERIRDRHGGHRTRCED